MGSISTSATSLKATLATKTAYAQEKLREMGPYLKEQYAAKSAYLGEQYEAGSAYAGAQYRAKKAYVQESIATFEKPKFLVPIFDEAGLKTFSTIVAIAQVGLLVLFTCVGSVATVDSVEDAMLYNVYIGVVLMMVVGFGFLMTFLRWYGMGSVGLTLLITAIGVQTALLTESFFSTLWWHGVTISYQSLIEANLAVAAVLISFGANIGKVTPAQLVVLTLIECVAYSFNGRVLLEKIVRIEDCGKSIVIHMFGAYFGLAVAYVLGPPVATVKEKSSTASEVVAFLGTTTLWLYWPSFVSATLAPGTLPAQRAITNTVLALCGSTVATFVASPRAGHKRIDPVHAQRATLAGGVAIGAVANFPMRPSTALFIGICAGLVSTAGFAVNILDAKLGLHDSCGVHNLHGMPSVLGAVFSVILRLFETAPGGTWYGQIAAIACTLGVAVGAGYGTGLVLRLPLLKPPSIDPFDDSTVWECAEDFGAPTVLSSEGEVEMPLSEKKEASSATHSHGAVDERSPLVASPPAPAAVDEDPEVAPLPVEEGLEDGGADEDDAAPEEEPALSG
mmetsp:Transcript_1325/g.5106  ORF Transcript_1325/g.5106 Transcript_1325/m.5106 type:complete len:563 (+) Transcript_1325:1-1689(+)